MDTTMYDQLWGLLLAVLIGALFAVLYDSFRILRYGARSKRTGLLVEDVVYWVICAFVGFAFLLKVNDGVIRFYLLAGMLAGAVAYRMTLSKLVTALFFRAADAIRAAADRLRRTAYRPIDRTQRMVEPHVRLWRRRRNLKNFKKDFQLKERRSKIKGQDGETVPPVWRRRAEGRGGNEAKSRKKEKKRRGA